MRIAESRIRRIIREEARRIIRENDEGPSGFTGEGDYASWDDIYKILEMRMNHETGRNGIWVKTGYRPESEPESRRHGNDRTHMMEGNYMGLFDFVIEYLSDFNDESHGPFGRYYTGPKPTSFDKVVRAREPDRDKRFDKVIRFMKEFESNFPGAANQDKIDDRRLGGPGPNRTKTYSPMLIPIPYFDGFKEVVLTWLTNTLTGEDRPIPWPEDRELT